MNLLKKTFIGLLFTLLVIMIFVGIWAYSTLNNSLPKLNGIHKIQNLSHKVIIERDAQGIATIKATNRVDIATATGFIHAQERFFQMDLLRRNSAGELSNLFGAVALDYDKSIRLHRFRDRAKKIVAQLPQDQLELLSAYTKGVNDGLSALGAKPFEYFLLQQSPKAWREEDSILTVLSMYLDLQYADGKREKSLGLMKAILSADVYAFLNPKGSIWDAAIDKTQRSSSPMPKSAWPLALTNYNADKMSVNNLNAVSSNKASFSPFIASTQNNNNVQSDVFPGSNNWAVAGKISETNSAIIANDMHLGIRVPNIWFRASFEYKANKTLIEHGQTDHSKTEQVKVTGATLPGTPNMVVGSNGHVAWGFTNSYGDYNDIVLLKTNEDGSQYLTPDGYKRFDIKSQVIKVKGDTEATMTIKETIWGPVIGKNHQGHLMAYRWVAHDVNAVNLYATNLENAKNIDEAIHIANLSAIPSQNMVVGDSNGNIGWTIMGVIPKKIGGIGETPSFWHDGSKGWQGYLSPADYPRKINPIDNRLWTANSRVVGGDMLDVIGNGGYALGARNQQIRDALYEKEIFNEKDLLSIALDDRAIFLKRWQTFLSSQVLTSSAIKKHPQFEEVKTLLESSKTLTASTDSVSYLLIRNFRMNVRDSVFSEFIKKLDNIDESFNFRSIRSQMETPLWEMVTQQNNNFKLLSKSSMQESSWTELFNKALLKTINDMTNKGTDNEQTLANATWGQYNTSAIKHPLSKGVPFIGRWLDMPATQLSGDSYMPKVQGIAFGASERMVVSPGHEESGIFHMATGQSAHPLSSYYRIGHNDWEQGRPSAFLPGKTQYSLELQSN